jgi:hypothetical protein
MAYVIRAKLCGSVSTFAAESDAAALRAIHELRAEHASVVVIDTATSEQVDEFDIENRIDGVGAAFAPGDAQRP